MVNKRGVRNLKLDIRVTIKKKKKLKKNWRKRK